MIPAGIVVMILGLIIGLLLVWSAYQSRIIGNLKRKIQENQGRSVNEQPSQSKVF